MRRASEAIEWLVSLNYRSSKGRRCAKLSTFNYFDDGVVEHIIDHLDCIMQNAKGLSLFWKLRFAC